jgi:hypothetical protein
MLHALRIANARITKFSWIRPSTDEGSGWKVGQDFHHHCKLRDDGVG